MDFYPVDLQPDGEGGWIATVDDLGALSDGADPAEAVARVADAAAAVVRLRFRKRLPIPAPSPAGDRPTIRLPALLQLKIGLYRAMRAQSVTQMELADRLGQSQGQVNRLLQPDHASQLDQMEAAFRALGLTIDPVLVPLDPAPEAPAAISAP